MQHLPWRRPAALLLLLFVCLPAARADAPVKEPINLLVNEGFARSEAGWTVPDTDTAHSDLVPAQAGPYRQALRVTANPAPGDHPWDVSLRQDVAVPIHKGDPLVLKAWLRSPQSLPVGAFVEQGSSPYAKFVIGSLTLTPDWKEYEVRGTADADYPTGKADAIFHLGAAKGVIEITGIRLFNPDAPAGLPVNSGATPGHPVSLIENGNFAAPTGAPWTPAGALQTEIVDAQIAGAAAYKKALRLTTTQAVPDAPWTVQIGQLVQRTVGREEAIYFRAWMRSPDRCHVTAIYEQAHDPNTKSLTATARLTPQWKEYRFLGYAAQGFAPGESQTKLFVGQDKGVVEVAGVRVEAYGPAPASLFSPTVDYYGGAEVSDDWRVPALARIEKIRKGDLRVQVVDAAGRPVRGAAVRATEMRALFRWGTAAPAGRFVDGSNPNDVRFQQEVLRLFNTVTLENDLKWQNSDDDPRDVEKAEQAIDWLHANGIAVRGHNLVWGSWQYSPARLKDMTPDEERQAVEARVRGFVRRFRGKVYVWDGVNEATNENDLWKKIGWEYFANVYKWARAEDPNVLLAYNDYHALGAPDSAATQQEYEHVQYLIDQHAPLDVLGEQAHLGPQLIPISDVLTRLDRLARFGKRIEITEFDLGVPDDTMHARYVRDFLTAAFSEPAVDGVIQWGFWEGSHWRAAEGAAMFRRDWSKRPGEEAYEDLVLHQWRTNATGKTGTDGAYGTHAFLGNYDVTVTAGGKTKTIHTTLTAAGQSVKVTLP